MNTSLNERGELRKTKGCAVYTIEIHNVKDQNVLNSDCRQCLMKIVFLVLMLTSQPTRNGRFLSLPSSLAANSACCNYKALSYSTAAVEGAGTWCFSFFIFVWQLVI